MSENTEIAINCFRQNITLFGNADTEPEKYNLYNGLIKLAEAIETLESDIQIIKDTVRTIESQKG